MKAGRELDALVAREVMGFSDARVVGTLGAVYDFTGAQGMPRKYVPNYSTDIAAAWEVVEKLKVLMNIFNDFEIEISSSSEFRNEWEVSVKWLDDYQGYGPFYFTADTAPLAICLAALKAVNSDTSL